MNVIKKYKINKIFILTESMEKQICGWLEVKYNINIIAWKPLLSDTEKPTRDSYLVLGEARETK